MTKTEQEGTVATWLRSRPETVPALLLICFYGFQVAAAPPYLTGTVEDAEAQTIEMPLLPNAWQSRIEWLAPEGSVVQPGDLVTRIDPGTLLVNEETELTSYEQRTLVAERTGAQMALAVHDAETAVLQAESALAMARLEAGVPETARRKLDYDQFQLSLRTAEQNLIQAKSELLSTQTEMKESEHVEKVQVDGARSQWQRFVDAREKTEVRATKAGFFIYGENRFSGKKIFPGETYPNGTQLALVASQKDLQFRFWVHEADVRLIRKGAELLVTPDAAAAVSVNAVVDWSSMQANTRDDWSQGGYFEVTAKPKDVLPDAFIPGMAVRAELVK